MDSKTVEGRGMKDIEKKIQDIQSLISEDAIRRNEQIIAVDVEPFKNVEGEEVIIRVSSASLESMKRDVKEYEEKHGKVEDE